METIKSPTKIKAAKEHRCDFCLGKIEEGSEYIKSVYKYDFIYSWKAHKKCDEIASKLEMYEDCVDGVTAEGFAEKIRQEYSDLMSKTQNCIYESKNFVLPNFEGQLQFVLAYYGI